jgi:hypothetical protein
MLGLYLEKIHIMAETQIKSIRIYLKSVLTSILINTLFLAVVCTTLQFDAKSAVCLYLFGGLGYAIKAFLFFLPYLLFIKDTNFEVKPTRLLIIWMPFFLYFFWFFIIILFQIESLMPDLSYGYIMRFPHFYLQIISTLVVCITTTIQLKKLAKIIHE